jgi:pyridoxamine 5'-phosphate oxidase
MDPFEKFQTWLEAARNTDLPEPTAFTLATVGEAGAPDARVMLLKGFDSRGFVFFTNFESRKGGELHSDPRACMNFYWPPMARQVRIEGSVTQVTEGEADSYFATRPRGSQIGAWASPQSRPVASREELEHRFRDVEARFEGKEVQRPPHWSGFRLKPDRIEFWTGRPDRMHDRERYVRNGPGWKVELLGP